MADEEARQSNNPLHPQGPTSRPAATTTTTTTTTAQQADFQNLEIRAAWTGNPVDRAILRISLEVNCTAGFRYQILDVRARNISVCEMGCARLEEEKEKDNEVEELEVDEDYFGPVVEAPSSPLFGFATRWPWIVEDDEEEEEEDDDDDDDEIQDQRGRDTTMKTEHSIKEVIETGDTEQALISTSSEEQEVPANTGLPVSLPVQLLITETSEMIQSPRKRSAALAGLDDVSQPDPVKREQENVAKSEQNPSTTASQQKRQDPKRDRSRPKPRPSRSTTKASQIPVRSSQISRGRKSASITAFETVLRHTESYPPPLQRGETVKALSCPGTLNIGPDGNADSQLVACTDTNLDVKETPGGGSDGVERDVSRNSGKPQSHNANSPLAVVTDGGSSTDADVESLASSEKPSRIPSTVSTVNLPQFMMPPQDEDAKEVTLDILEVQKSGTDFDGVASSEQKPQVVVDGGWVVVTTPNNFQADRYRVVIIATTTLVEGLTRGWQDLKIPGLPRLKPDDSGTLLLQMPKHRGLEIRTTCFRQHHVVDENCFAAEFTDSTNFTLPLKACNRWYYGTLKSFTVDQEIRAEYVINSKVGQKLDSSDSILPVKYMATFAVTAHNRFIWADRCCFFIELKGGPDGRYRCRFDAYGKGLRIMWFEAKEGALPGVSRIQVDCSPRHLGPFVLSWVIELPYKDEQNPRSWLPRIRPNSSSSHGHSRDRLRSPLDTVEQDAGKNTERQETSSSPVLSSSVEPETESRVSENGAYSRDTSWSLQACGVLLLVMELLLNCPLFQAGMLFEGVHAQNTFVMYYLFGGMIWSSGTLMALNAACAFFAFEVALSMLAPHSLALWLFTSSMSSSSYPEVAHHFSSGGVRIMSTPAADTCGVVWQYPHYAMCSGQVAGVPIVDQRELYAGMSSANDGRDQDNENDTDSVLLRGLKDMRRDNTNVKVSAFLRELEIQLRGSRNIVGADGSGRTQGRLEK